ncbi:MAG: hypothetical protein PWP65_2089 [Clostridia bacterium]|nr:hypothetical protein [Clostridia bacterium]
MMLELVLEEASRLGAETELLEITDLDIKPCKSCNQCLKVPQCSIQDDDMGMLAAKIKAADGLVLGSPVYFGNVSARLKNFMDRTRWLYLLDHISLSCTALL